LTAATELGCERIVIAASMEEPQVAPAVPASPYGAAKWAATGYVRMFYDLYQSPVVITRPFMTYGPRQRPHKIIPHVILSLLRGQARALGSGTRLVDWLYVDDAIDAFLLAGSHPDIAGAELDLGSGERVAIREVVCKIADLIATRDAIRFGDMPDRPQRAE